ncbi:F-box protein FBW2-like [Gossypium australe]|uniref:F-box protein FBW2-like n=1 Tax=Gossypium australe TaxID=47621 RepID=A0A5B6W9Z4_9ROSI|nr:F-box protein FBW2-like [Gossypium australe]
MEEEQREFRRWDQLPPDAVRGSHCWQDIDLFQWSIRWKPHQLDQMLPVLVTRSSGSLCSLHVAGLRNDSIFSFITENAGSLQVLRLSGSLISGSIIKQTAQRLSTLTFLDLTNCPRIGAQALEAIGKYCKLRDMMFLDVLGKVEAEDEANAIAATMPRLKHLDLGFHLISTECALNILSRCHQLERLILNVCMEEEQSEFRHWDELLPDVLGLIFTNLSIQELLTVIPCVCKSWSKVVTGPHCWQYVDLDERSCRRLSHQLDRMLRMLITRSNGSLRSLHVSGLQNDSIFSFITENLGSLQVLRLPRSLISDSIVKQTAQRLSTVTFLDLSYCHKIGAQAIEAIGKHCKHLVVLCRNMYSLDSAGKVEAEDEANAIASTMPRLKQLEFAYRCISTECVLNLLSCCPQLVHLKIDEFLSEELDRKFLKEKYPKLEILLLYLIILFESDESDDDEYLDM